MLKKIGLAFGVIFVLVGLAGYVPALTPDGKLLGVFAVNGAHNLVHVLTGVIAVAIALASPANMAAFLSGPTRQISASGNRSFAAASATLVTATSAPSVTRDSTNTRRTSPPRNRLGCRMRR